MNYVGSRYLNKRNTALAGQYATLGLLVGYRHGRYEVRLLELPRKLQTGTKQLWLELFDHHYQRTIDSYGSHNLVDITVAAEKLCSKAKDLSEGESILLMALGTLF